jgi:hypothetical protein
MKRQRTRAIRVRRVHPDMERYLGHPKKVGADQDILLKPNNVNLNWFFGAIGRNASFGIQAIPGWWDGEKFTESWVPEAREAANKYWPKTWKDHRAAELA